MTDNAQGTPKVVMVVVNAVTGDSRVQKVAWTASQAGWDCLLVGVDKRGRRARGSIGGCPVEVVAPAVPPRPLAQARRVARGLRRRAQRLAAPPGAAQGVTGAARALLWRVAVGAGDYRRTQPELRDLAEAIVPRVVAARPDILHAHDYTSLAVVLPALAQLEALGRRPRLVYDAHEFLPGVHGHDRVWMAAMTDLERRGITVADEVITVSEPLAELLRREHGLTVPVTVVTNAPVVEPMSLGGPRDVREAVGVAAPAPLLVYSGGVAPQRGLDTAVAALAELPGVHLALVSGRNRHVEALLARAREAGVADRVHVTAYVPPAEVSAFLTGASAGVVTNVHLPNHEISLPTKYFEYAHARLPVVVSDVAEMARRTRELGNGVVFTAGDPASFATAVRQAIADGERYAAAYTPAVLEEFRWGRQEPALLGVYARLVGVTPTPPAASATFGACPLTLA